MAAASERRHDGADIERRRLSEGEHRRRVRQLPAQTRRADVARQHERAGLEQRVARIDRSAPCEDGDLGLGGDAELTPQLGVRRCFRRVDLAGAPGPARARA